MKAAEAIALQHSTAAGRRTCQWPCGPEAHLVDNGSNRPIPPVQLTHDQIQVIRRLGAGGIDEADISKFFDVTPADIKKILDPAVFYDRRVGFVGGAA